MSGDLSKPKSGKRKSLGVNEEKKESNRVIKAVHKNDGQREALATVDANTVTILTGVAGTGKTYLAVSYALQMLMRDKWKKVIFTRPVVEAGESLGYLPGDFDEKIAPYMIPIMDIMWDHLSPADIIQMFEDGKLMVLPLAYMRGVTFKNCCVILDEAQNATVKQLHMFLTRTGENCKVIITGDATQSDLGFGSGLKSVMGWLKEVPNLGMVHLDQSCVVRDPIVAVIDARFREHASEREGFKG